MVNKCPGVSPGKRIQSRADGQEANFQVYSYRFFKGHCNLKAIILQLMRWMKLEPIIQSEVSQKEKHQYSILTHIYGI